MRFIAAIACCLLGNATAWAAEDSECTKLYNLSKSNPGLFAGLGRARAADAAADAARADMAKEISSKVTATTKTSETNKNVSVESVIESKVNLVLVGAKISRRCKAGSSHEAVVTLPREILIKNLSTMLDASDRKAQNYLGRIKKAKGQAKVSLLVESRKFLDEAAFDDSLTLCKSFNGCADVGQENISALESLLDDKENAELVGKANLFTVRYQNELSEEVGGEIKTLLEQDGIVVSDDAPAEHVVRIDCSEKIFPKVGESQILEVNCRASGTVEGQKRFSYSYAGRGVGPTPKDARVGARNLLEKVK